MKATGHGMLPAGIVLTGGGAELAGAAELGREVLQMPVRIAGPAGVGGLVDNLLTPANSTAIGLLRWGAGALAQGEPAARIGPRDGWPQPDPGRPAQHLPLIRAAPTSHRGLPVPALYDDDGPPTLPSAILPPDPNDPIPDHDLPRHRGPQNLGTPEERRCRCGPIPRTSR